MALDTNLDYFFVDSIEQNKEVTYEEINDLLEDMTPDQRVIAMDLVKFVSDNSDKIKSVSYTHLDVYKRQYLLCKF